MIDIFAMLPCHAVPYHYAVQFIVNLKNGTWTGPQRLIIAGKTLASAWDVMEKQLKRQYQQAQHISLLRWVKLDHKAMCCPEIRAQAAKQKEQGLCICAMQERCLCPLLHEEEIALK